MTEYRNEGDVKRKAKKLLDKHGWFWWMPPANGYGRSGISDINALKRGVFLAIETKFGKNTPTALQRGFLQSINAEDSFGFVVSDSNMEWLEEFLEVFSNTTETMRKQGTKPSTEDGSRMLNAIAKLTEEIV